MNKQQLTGELIMPKEVFLKPLVGQTVQYITVYNNAPKIGEVLEINNKFVKFKDGNNVALSYIKELVLHKHNPEFLQVIHVDTFIEHGGVITPGRPIFIARQPWQLWGTYAPDQSDAAPYEIVVVPIGDPATMPPRTFNREILGVQIQLVPIWK